MKNKVQLSVIIVNYNGKTYLKNCLESILKSNFSSLEIIVVDNGSNDGSLDMLTEYKNRRTKFKINFVTLAKNYGPSFARNRGVDKAKGTFLGFLDNDTYVHPDWAKQAVKEFINDKKLAIIQCKLLLKKNKGQLDYVGEYLGQNGFLVQLAKTGEEDRGQFNQKIKILAAKSAGMFIRKEVFSKVGGFDNDYFIYVEETDLGWRSWLAGFYSLYLPESIVYHEFGTSAVILGKTKNSYNAKFHGSKNYILTLYKNLSFANLFLILLPHILLWEGLAFYSLLRREIKNFLWINQGIIWNFLHLISSTQKRMIIQRTRKINDAMLFKLVMKKRPFKYFLQKAVTKQRVGNAESF